ncbi:MAG: hypothetical protein V4649_10030 [Bacteroidota bacterium]
MENYTDKHSEIFSLEVDPYGKATFLEMARWTKFLAILGYIFLGLMLLMGVVMLMAAGAASTFNSAFAGLGAMSIFIMFLFIIAIYFYPIFALMKYSTNMKMAMLTNSKSHFNEAIRHLKNMFKYVGILAIIFLCLYGLVFIFAILGAAITGS